MAVLSRELNETRFLKNSRLRPQILKIFKTETFRDYNIKTLYLVRMKKKGYINDYFL